ncbi:MAG: hypothetical protein QOJ99_2182 [Bryobacterales bacterium]|jgi:hypothetical protein|nr:hypothetical protein [Bryobacterales bacterium]
MPVWFEDVTGGVMDQEFHATGLKCTAAGFVCDNRDGAVTTIVSGSLMITRIVARRLDPSVRP